LNTDFFNIQVKNVRPYDKNTHTHAHSATQSRPM